MIFVFGSNRAGIHGAGAARHAHKHLQAKWGVGEGRTGKCYALPTKNHSVQTLLIREVEKHVKNFLEHAKNNPFDDFQVTRVACGLAGYKDHEIAPLFVGGQENIYYDTAWKDYLTDNSRFWGTM